MGFQGLGHPGLGPSWLALSLQQLKDSALHNNLAIRTARHNIEYAREQRQEAFTKYFPNVSGTGMWFNANKGMARMDVNPSELIPSGLAPTLAQMLPIFEVEAPNIRQQEYSLPSLRRRETEGGLGAGVRLTPEYQLLQKQVEATQLMTKMAIGQNLPTVAVGAGYNYHDLLDVDRSFGMIFATVSVPISDWWGGSHAIKRKKIEQQKAIDQLNDNTQLLQIRMQNAWNSVVEAQQQLQLAQRSIEQAEENLRLHRDYYRAGTTTMSSLLEAQLLYQQSSDKYTDAYAELQSKILEYRQSIGER